MASVSSDKEWEAEEDVRTLIRANEILSDPKRKKRAAAKMKEQKAATDKAAALLEKKTGERLAKLRKS